MPMTRRTIATLASAGISLGALAAAPLAAGAVDQERPQVGLGAAVDEAELRKAVLQAAEQAQALQSDASTDDSPSRRSATDPDAPTQAPAPPLVAGDDLDAALEQADADGAIGITARVDTPDLQWSGAAGERRLDRQPPALDNSPFRAASNTKTMIATLVLQQVEAGTWTLDTRVDDVIPGLFPDHPDVTIEHLLSHTSGLPLGTYETLIAEGLTGTDWASFVTALGQDYTDQDHIDAANAAPWPFEPGTGWNYSNTGYVALGMLLEAATGQSVESLLRRGVLPPAGRQHTAYPDEPGLRGLALKEAMWTEEGWVRLDGFDPEVFSHSGAVVSTTEDLIDLNDALFTGELVSQSTVDQMLTPVVPNPLNYGLGVYSIPDPCAPGEYLSGHDGATFGTLSVNYSSRDGSRQLSFGVTGRDLTASQDALYDLNAVLVPMLLATC